MVPLCCSEPVLLIRHLLGRLSFQFILVIHRHLRKAFEVLRNCHKLVGGGISGRFNQLALGRGERLRDLLCGLMAEHGSFLIL